MCFQMWFSGDEGLNCYRPQYYSMNNGKIHIEQAVEPGSDPGESLQRVLR